MAGDMTPLERMLTEAVEFVLWAVGEGICPVDGEPAREPESILMDYTDEVNDDAWETFPSRIVALLRADRDAAVRAAVEAEREACAQTVLDFPGSGPKAPHIARAIRARSQGGAR